MKYQIGTAAATTWELPVDESCDCQIFDASYSVDAAAVEGWQR
jgi:hypothetical protein